MTVMVDETPFVRGNVRVSPAKYVKESVPSNIVNSLLQSTWDALENKVFNVPCVVEIRNGFCHVENSVIADRFNLALTLSKYEFADRSEYTKALKVLYYLQTEWDLRDHFNF